MPLVTITVCVLMVDNVDVVSLVETSVVVTVTGRRVVSVSVFVTVAVTVPAVLVTRVVTTVVSMVVALFSAVWVSTVIEVTGVIVVTGIVTTLVSTVVSVSVVVAVVIVWALPNWISVLNAMKQTITNSRPKSILDRLNNRDSLL